MLFQRPSFLFVIVRLHFLFLLALPLTGLAQKTSIPMLTVPVQVHLITGLEFVERDKNINNWVTPEDFTASVLPEINRIWKPAGIQWKTTTVVVEAAKKGPALQAALKRIEERELVAIPTFRQLLVETGHPEIIQLYLLPSIGAANGVTARGGTIALVGIWRKKGPHDLQRAPLVLSAPELPSVAKTCAHELGHTLGLVHPKERQIERLMQAGPGTELTAEEITTARVRAAKLGK